MQALSGRLNDGIANLEAAATAPNSGMDHRQNLAFGYVIAGNIDKARRMASVDLDVQTVEVDSRPVAEAPRAGQGQTGPRQRERSRVVVGRGRREVSENPRGVLLSAPRAPQAPYPW